MHRLACIIFLTLGFMNFASASDHLRDYYQEPGLNPFKEDAGTASFESIDPFSGALQLQHVDITLPGNGGMDMNVTRFYNNPQAGAEIDAFGIGWTMHPGRLVISSTYAGSICNQINGTLPFNTRVTDNPSYELPDGSRKVFFRDMARGNTQYISRDNWRLQCGGTSGTTYIITSPSGTQYYATQASRHYGSPLTSWYVTLIRDVHNNEININYVAGYTGALNYFVMDRMWADDGREIQFYYTNPGTLSITLDRIDANTPTDGTRTWTYTYTPLTGTAFPYYYLSSVRRPDTSEWRYEYWPTVLGPNDTLGRPDHLRLVTLPYVNGGSYCYEYVFVLGYTSNAVFRKTRNTCSANITNTRLQPSWEYTYDRDLTLAEPDHTIISLPENTGRIEYDYHSIREFMPAPQGNLWKVGLLLEKRIYDGNSLVEIEQSDWSGRQISGDYYQQAGTYYDLNTLVPQLDERRIYRSSLPTGLAYTTTYQAYDAFGNPGRIIESGEATRTTDFTYYNNTTNWILGKTESETITGIGSTTRVFDVNNGNLDSETAYGVTTNYTYYPSGDLYTVTDARASTTTYNNYKAGVAQDEIRPQAVNISRVVSDWGTVASETNGRGFATTYNYDDMNRVTGITLPRVASLPTSVDWNTTYYGTDLAQNFTGRVLTRGDFRQLQDKDDYGRLIDSINSNTLTNEHIRVSYRYDGLDRKTFESHPRIATASNYNELPATIPGTSYRYDVFNRITRITHQDGNFVQYDYRDDRNTVQVTDERGNITIYTYRSFGNPNQKSLLRIDSPENIVTIIDRNEIGQVTRVWQGDNLGSGYERTYTYDVRRFLETVTNPETGVTTYGYDEVGNMTSKQVGASGITYFTYDSLNRLRLIDYPGVTPDARFYYDRNNNITGVTNANSSRVYTYNNNDSLTNESININSTRYNINYEFDVMDNLATMTYPFGRVVDYAPDVFGRPTQALPFVNSVYYYPSGQLDQIAYQSGIITNFNLDNRLRVDRIQTAGLTAIGDLTYAYDPSSNIDSITNAVEPGYNRSFTYDGVNRLVTANGIWGTGTFTYDQVGNLTQKVIGGITTDFTYLNNQLNQLTESTGTIYNYTYDTYGNISDDGVSRTMNFDDAQNLINASLYGVTLPAGESPDFDYLYDGNNMRVMRTKDTVWTHYVYSKGGNLLADMMADQNDVIQHFYLGAKRVASIKGLPTPVANAGSDQTAIEGNVITLDGSATVVPALVTVTYQWIQTTGVPVTIDTPTAVTSTVTLPSGVYYSGPLTFSLQVTPTSQNTGMVEDTVNIVVNLIDTDGDALSDVWETTNFGDTATYTATGDPDLDGYTNLEEFQLGLDPNVAQPLDKPNGAFARPGNGQNTIIWPNVSRALSYDIYWGTSSGVTTTTGTLISNVTSPYVHTGLTNGQTYYYIIVSKNMCCSTPSNELRIATGMDGWGAPMTISGRQAVSKPVNGVFHNVYYEGTRTAGEFACIHRARKFSESTGWDAPIELMRSPNCTSRMASNNRGDVYVPFVSVVWDGVSHTSTLHSRLYRPETGWISLPDVLIPGSIDLFGDTFSNHIQTELDIDESGNIHVVWSNDVDVSSVRYDVLTGWSAIETLYIFPSGTRAEELFIDMTDVGNVMVAWTTLLPDNSVTVTGSYYKLGTGWGALATSEFVPPSPTFDIRHFSFKVAVNDMGQAIIFGAECDWWGTGCATWVLKQFDNISGWQFSEFPKIDFTVSSMDSDLVEIEYSDTGQIAIMAQLVGGASEDVTVAFNYVYHPGIGWRMPDPVIMEAGWVSDSRNIALVTNGSSITNVVSTNNPGWWNSDPGEILDYTYSAANGINTPLYVVTLEDNIRTESVIEMIPGPDGNKTAYGWGWVNYYWRIPGVPVSNAGPNRMVSINDTVILDGSGSRDDSSIVSYQWTQIEGPPVTIADPTMPVISFVADTGTWIRGIHDVFDKNYIWENKHKDALVFELRVVDDVGLVGIDTVRIRVNQHAPIANAGPDQRIDLLAGDSPLVSLDGTGSTDENGTIVSYQWEPAVYLTGADTAIPSFDVSALTRDAYYTFTLTVTDDDGATGVDTVYISVNANSPPVANAGPDQFVYEGTTVSLDASLSSDVDSPIAGYDWFQISGPTVTLTNQSTISPSFVAPAVADTTVFEFGLYAYDEYFEFSEIDHVRVVVHDVTSTDMVPPIVTAPADITVEAMGEFTMVTLGAASANDDVDGIVIPVPSTLGPFTIGTHSVTWTATDIAGNPGSALQTVTVQDTIPPVLTVPANVSVESDVPIAVTIGTATATDIFTPVTIINNAPALFPVGITIVTWTATDANGVSSTGTQMVTVTASTDVTPTLTFIEPVADVTVTTGSLMLRWDDTDPDSSATIALYYDTDNVGADGTLIVDNLAEDAEGAGDSYNWGVTTVPQGTYYVYAVITDGNTSSTVYAP